MMELSNKLADSELEHKRAVVVVVAALPVVEAVVAAAVLNVQEFVVYAVCK